MKDDKSFDKIWGANVRKRGFTQLPNLMHRNASRLGMSPLDLSVLTLLLSYGEEIYVSASMITDALGICDRSVRTAYRSLEAKGLIERVLVSYNANYFKYDGLRKRIDGLANLPQAPRQVVPSPLSNIIPKHRQILPTEHEQNLPTNKETNIKDDGSTPGYDTFKQQGNKLKKKK